MYMVDTGLLGQNKLMIVTVGRKNDYKKNPQNFFYKL